MIGTKSNVFNLKVVDKFKNVHFLKLQANKNYGLCDVISEFKKKYNEASYNEAFRSAILNEFQGRQLNDPIVIQEITNLANDLLKL